jgi:hypothetical protein
VPKTDPVLSSSLALGKCGENQCNRQQVICLKVSFFLYLFASYRSLQMIKDMSKNIAVAYKYRVQIFIKIQTLVTQFLQIQVPDMFTLPLTETLLK